MDSGLPAGKALPTHLAPAAAWKLCADGVALTLAPAIQDWRDSFMVWLNKPNKDPHRPQGLRPIGLAHPVAKTLGKILRERIRPQLEGQACICL